jgi:hypothetical protein
VLWAACLILALIFTAIILIICCIRVDRLSYRNCIIWIFPSYWVLFHLLFREICIISCFLSTLNSMTLNGTAIIAETTSWWKSVNTWILFAHGREWCLLTCTIDSALGASWWFLMIFTYINYFRKSFTSLFDIDFKKDRDWVFFRFQYRI